MHHVACWTALAIVAVGCGDGKPDPEMEKARIEANYIDLAKDRMKGRAKDPGSVQFRNIFVSRSAGVPVVCGEVNAKNSFGGYGGYQRFFSAGEIQVVEKDMAAGEMDKSWDKFCGR